MNHESDNDQWPAEAGDPKALGRERKPPEDLEDKVVQALMNQGLIHADAQPIARHPGWQVMRASLAVAACAALVALGVLIGRFSIDTSASHALTGAEQDLYALLMYETEGYDRPDAIGAISRYGEYNQWVAQARQRQQFVTGEDLEVDRGWLLVPSPDGATVEPATSIAADAPLSGIFFIRAANADKALELARALPHLKHGGRVLVQKTVPTDVPPPTSG